jgi:hypothetical protein
MWIAERSARDANVELPRHTMRVCSQVKWWIGRSALPQSVASQAAWPLK